MRASLRREIAGKAGDDGSSIGGRGHPKQHTAVLLAGSQAWHLATPKPQPTHLHCGDSPQPLLARCCGDSEQQLRHLHRGIPHPNAAVAVACEIEGRWVTLGCACRRVAAAAAAGCHAAGRLAATKGPMVGQGVVVVAAAGASVPGLLPSPPAARPHPIQRERMLRQRLPRCRCSARGGCGGGRRGGPAAARRGRGRAAAAGPAAGGAQLRAARRHGGGASRLRQQRHADGGHKGGDSDGRQLLDGERQGGGLPAGEVMHHQLPSLSQDHQAARPLRPRQRALRGHLRGQDGQAGRG